MSVFDSDQIFLFDPTVIKFLGCFRVSRESTYCLRSPSVRPSVSIYQRRYHWTDFREIFLYKCVEKHQIWWTSDKNIGHFTWRPCYFYIVDSSTKYFV